MRPEPDVESETLEDGDALDQSLVRNGAGRGDDGNGVARAKAAGFQPGGYLTSSSTSSPGGFDVSSQPPFFDACQYHDDQFLLPKP